MEELLKPIQFYGKTDPGIHRKANQDIFFIDDKNGIIVVADGIGGAPEGDVASWIFAKTARETFSNAVHISEKNAAFLVEEAFKKANRAIFSYANENPARKGMGCTAEIIIFYEGGFALGHMGDSRTFRLRNEELVQLTTDHSLAQEQLDKGLITQEEADHHPYKNVILRAVGIEKNPLLDVLEGTAASNDRFLLCTDGLSDMVDLAKIQEYLISVDSIRQAVDNLIQAARQNGGRDNITAVLADIG